MSGGAENEARAGEATVSGGFGNKARGGSSTIGGGSDNLSFGVVSTIGGGARNKAQGFGSVVSGGEANQAGGLTATVPGGTANTALGDYSFAAGRNAQARHEGSLVWADSGENNHTSTDVNQFLIRASGGVGMGTTSPTEMLVVGDDLGLDAPGNRITIGDDSGPSGINLGEDTNHRAFILWQRNNDYLELGTRAGGVIHGNNLVVRQGNVAYPITAPVKSLQSTATSWLTTSLLPAQ